MKILVTGGCGFIGSHLVKKLAEAGHEVVVLDNLSTGKKERLGKGTKLIKGDIRDEDDVARAAKGCGLVFHLAASTDARSEDAVYETNFIGAKNVFDAAKAAGAKVVFASSAAVYGDGKLPCSEEAECKPVSQYGKSKLKAESALKKHKEFFILRFFNVYGPEGKSVVNRFCEKIPQYDDITVFGNGLQTRDYVFVSDAVDAMILGIEKNGLYNVGTGKETSILQLIDVVHEACGCRPSVKFSAEKKGEIKRSRADIAGIKSLGWQPRTGLKEGVRAVLSAR